MTMETMTVTKKSFRSPDETRTFPNGKVEIIHFEDRAAALVTLRPGWKWSTDVRPLEQAQTCQTTHLQYVISGRLMVEMEGGKQMELSPGDFVLIPPGHDAWVVGNEPFVAVDLLGMTDYAKPQDERGHPIELEEIVGFD
jgi:mannose-6-phosphate isomerase-like protein (cupin superfamily)